MTFGFAETGLESGLCWLQSLTDFVLLSGGLTSIGTAVCEMGVLAGLREEICTFKSRWVRFVNTSGPP